MPQTRPSKPRLTSRYVVDIDSCEIQICARPRIRTHAAACQSEPRQYLNTAFHRAQDARIQSFGSLVHTSHSPSHSHCCSSHFVTVFHNFSARDTDPLYPATHLQMSYHFEGSGEVFVPNVITSRGLMKSSSSRGDEADSENLYIVQLPPGLACVEFSHCAPGSSKGFRGDTARP